MISSELYKCKNNIPYFYEKYVLINNCKPSEKSINDLKKYIDKMNYNFVFDYMDYIDNIMDRNSLDDLEIYNQFNSFYTRDGVVYTLPLEKTIDILENRFNIEIKIDGDRLYMGGLTKTFDFYQPIISNIGYIIISFDDNSMVIEPYYDCKVEELPEHLYYVSTDCRDIVGIEPKFYNEFNFNNGRLFLHEDLDFCHKFGKSLSDDYIIYRVDTNGLNLPLYRDISLGGEVFYTTDNIKHDNISVEFSF